MRTSAWLALAFVSLCVSVTSVARAQLATTPSALEAPGLALTFGGSDEATARDTRPAPGGDRESFRHFSLTLNPITLLLNRYGGNVEVLPGRHHAISANPFYQAATEDSDNTTTSYSAFGGELGYRYYSGNDGPEGFFAGPSFIFMRGEMNEECRSAGCRVDPTLDTMTFGMAVDAGYQWMSETGLTLGGGVGAMYLRSDTSTRGAEALRFQGVLPRLLFSIGYST
jgi:hypothetical protein